MKKIICFVLAAMMVFALCACGDSGKGASTKELQIGFDRQSITPVQTGVQIAGGDASARLSTGFIDEVSTTCIAFAKDGNTFLIYTCDFMILYGSIINPIKTVIKNATGVPEENILFNCTHTHSGVNILSTKWDGGAQYRELFSSRALKAAENAIADLSPATVEIASCPTEGLSFVRHYDMNDGTTCGNGHGSAASGYKSHSYDAANELQAIKFVRGAEDKQDVLIMSFPAHATTVNGTNPTSVSACWPGATRAYLEENSDVLCAIFQGASGDQVPDSKIDGLSAARKDHKKYGQILGDYALALTFTPVPSDKVVLETWEFTGPTMKEGVEDVEKLGQASEISAVASQKGSSDPAVDALVAKYGFTNVYEATGLVNRSSSPETRTMVLNALQIGSDCSMVFAPYEMFGMHGETIKELSPFTMDFIVTCSEDYQGYFPHIEGCEQSYYEYDVTKYARGTGEQLAEIFGQKLTEMKNAG